MKLSKWEMVHGAPGGINMPCLMQDTRLSPKNMLKWQIYRMELKKDLDTKPAIM